MENERLKQLLAAHPVLDDGVIYIKMPDGTLVEYTAKPPDIAQKQFDELFK